ncbi:hypothetical protein, partial [Aureimonas sp. AU12]|uniref:hypothetical protein n=1 Tax=Aureimonas sp. AU12 TaxID=1638161 RepID=UPI000AC91089
MRWIAGLLRLLGCIVLAATTVLAVGDVARSLASDRMRLMTIGEAVTVAGFGPSPEAAAAPAASEAGVFAADGRRADPLAVVALQPASVVLGLGGAM